MTGAFELVPHPAAGRGGIERVGVSLRTDAAATLVADYHVRGEAAVASLRGALEGGRRDRIWEHTCGELFVAAPGAAAYGEYNFSPRGAWAAYAFSACRVAAERVAEVQAPLMSLETRGSGWDLQVRVPLADLVSLAGAAAGECPLLRLGLAVIVAPPGQAQQFWAVRHAAERPDFHRRESFVVEWPAC